MLTALKDRAPLPSIDISSAAGRRLSAPERRSNEVLATSFIIFVVISILSDCVLFGRSRGEPGLIVELREVFLDVRTLSPFLRIEPFLTPSLLLLFHSN